MKIGLVVLSCSRIDELKKSLHTYRAKIPGDVWKNSILHEDAFLDIAIDDLDLSYFSKTLKTSPPKGMGHALYKAYQEDIISSCEYTIHLEDDWEICSDIPFREICSFMRDNNIMQLFLSSKMTLQEAEAVSGKPIFTFNDGSLGLYLRSKVKHNFRHLWPNTTPNIMKTSLMNPYMEDIEKLISKELNPLIVFPKDKDREIDPEKPFMSIHSPLRAWKFWKHSIYRAFDGKLIRQGERDWAFLFLKDKCLMKHIGQKKRRRLSVRNKNVC